jgi:hypothetical protein
MVSDRLRPRDSVHQLIHDDLVDFFAFRGVRTPEFQSTRRELLGIDVALHQLASPGRTDYTGNRVQLADVGVSLFHDRYRLRPADHCRV